MEGAFYRRYVMNRDLTVGRPDKVLWAYCLPLFGSVIFQQLYNIADSLVAGKMVGENALAAVGNSYEVTLIFIAFAFGCNIGGSVIISRYFGSKEYSKMKTSVTTTLIASAVLCAVLMILGFSLSGKVLELINTPKVILSDSKLYLTIYILGVPFLFFYNIATGIFSALGDSRTPFFFLAISSTVNIFVDIWFVKIFERGVAGVAWATFLCQGVSCILALIFVFRRLSRIKTEEKAPVFSARILKEVIMIAVPSILQQTFISVGNIIIQSVINGFGPGVIAGYAAGVKINNLIITAFTTLGNGVSNYASQNLGAGKYSRIREGFKVGVRMVWMISVPIILLYWFGCKAMLNFFIDNPTAQAVSSGMLFLRILSPFYLVVSVKLISDGVLRGTGRMSRFMISTFADLILRVSLAVVFSSTALGSVGIWCAWPVGWSIGTVISVVFYLTAFSHQIDKSDTPEVI